MFKTGARRKRYVAQLPEKKLAMNTREFPPFLHDLLNSTPQAGEGVHNYLFRVARQLHAHLPAGEIVDLLESRVRIAGVTVPRHEIVYAVQNALACAWQPRGNAAPVQSAAKWPGVNQEQRAAIMRDDGGLADLVGIVQAACVDDNGQHTEEIIDRLFPGNPLLCCGQVQFRF